MAEVTRCDRCGAIFDEETLRTSIDDVMVDQIIIQNAESHFRRYFDMCPDCVRGFMWWMDYTVKQEEGSGIEATD